MTDPISSFFQQQLTTSNRDLFNFAANSLSIRKPLRELVIQFFRTENWEFTPTQNPSILRMACQGEISQWRCYAKVKETERQFAFYSVCPSKAPSEKLFAIAEFIARANYGVIIGNFELDFDDGEIRYKTSIDAQEIELNLDAIAQLVYTNVLMMDRYESPTNAIASIKS